MVNMEKMLTIENLKLIEEKLTAMNNNSTMFSKNINDIVRMFGNESIVKSFYASGKYGSSIETRLLEINEAVNEYFRTLSDGADSLIGGTKIYVADQIDLQQRDSLGYSIRDRREGN